MSTPAISARFRNGDTDLTTITACRVCGNGPLETVLDLGDLPLPSPLASAGRLEESDPAYPLELVRCGGCGLVQLRHEPPPSDPADEPTTGHSRSSGDDLHHARACVTEVIALGLLGPRSLVIEVGSNDGLLLGCYAEHGIPVLGIERSRGPARAAERAGVATLCTELTEDLVQGLVAEDRQADVLHCNRLLGRFGDPHALVSLLGRLLKKTGLLVVEVPYVKDLVDGIEIDTIRHDRRCLFSLATLMPLFQQHDLVVTEAKRLASDGGALRLYCASHGRPGGSVDALLRLEQHSGLDDAAYYQGLAPRAAAVKQGLVRLLRDLRSQGRRIVAYGAGTRGCNLINFCGIGPDLVDYIVDLNSSKHGRFVPGALLPICPTERLLEDQPDYCLLLAWDHAQEISSQQSEYRRRGGHFVTPLPEPGFI